MDLHEEAELLALVWEEQRRQMDGLYVVVNPVEEEQVRLLLDEAGYEPVHVLANKEVSVGTCYFMRPEDFAPSMPLVPEDLRRPPERRAPLWKRIRDSAFSGA